MALTLGGILPGICTRLRSQGGIERTWQADTLRDSERSHRDTGKHSLRGSVVWDHM